MSRIEELTVNAIRTLSVDAVQKANSGHPGMPLGSAPIAYSVWEKHLNFSTKNPKWINRDRFVLSAGHASALLYSLLHLFGYKVSIDDLKQFRQLGSITPGHPEYGHTDGVEATTGPLGAGLATAVGMAMAQAHMAATFNKEGYELIDNYTYVLSGDGCMMEGITSEASSLAGTLNLGRLIILYDSNNTTIEGHTDLAFKENIRQRYEAYGFETFLVEDGNDLTAINEAITKAKANLNQPSFIEIRTKIGYGSAQEGSSKAHGSPLGEESIKKLKAFLNYPSEEPFYVPEEVYQHTQASVARKESVYDAWQQKFAAYRAAYPEMAKKWDEYFTDIDIDTLLNDEALMSFESKPVSTRVASGVMINRFSERFDNLFGGSADLASSNMTMMNNESSFSADNYAGKNLHFGVREHAMAAMGNGIVLYGGLKSYVATFFVFADFLKPMLRLSALMKLPLTYVLTHDSIGVGEDGPTHEPVEQLAMLRATPNVVTFRPADAKETAYGWALALASKDCPVALVLSRQNLPVLETTSKDALKGGYVVYGDDAKDVVLMATGSEVNLAIDSAKKLETLGIKARVISMPSMELFKQQDVAYQERVLPKEVTARVAIEAGSSLPWGQFVGLNGAYVTLDRFGDSAPGNALFEKFGFTVDHVVDVVTKLVK